MEDLKPRVKALKAKLRKAFTNLNKNGIRAIQNFSCCQSCGTYAICDNPREGDIGYTFYHDQDNENLKERGECNLSFGRVVDSINEEQIGTIVCKALKEQNINYKWSGNAGRRIEVRA